MLTTLFYSEFHRLRRNVMKYILQDVGLPIRQNLPNEYRNPNDGHNRVIGIIE